MLPPKQSEKVLCNLRDRFMEERKAIRKLKVLVLTERPLSWIEDAKNCARIYVRMLQSRAVCPRILPLLSHWAQLLLDYAPAYGFGSPEISLIKRTPSPFQANEWLRRLLIEIRDIRNAEELYGRMVTSFRVESNVDDKGLCAVTHRQVRNRVIWRTVLDDNTEVMSQPVGCTAFLMLEQTIHQGLKRHRRIGYCQGLFRKIIERKQHGRNGRLHK